MKRKFLALLILPLFAFVPVVQTEVRFDDRVSVIFPDEPKEQMSGDNKMWRSGDANTIYLAMAVDFQKLGIDSTMMTAQLKLDEFYTGYRDGILSKLPEGKLIDESEGDFKGYPVRDYKFTMKAGEQNFTYYSKNVFIGTKVYSLSFIEKTDHPVSPERDRFFGSLKLK